MSKKIEIHIEIDPAYDIPEITIRTGEITPFVDRLVEQLKHFEEKDPVRINVYDDNSEVFLEQKDIFRVCTENKKIKVFTDSRSYFCRRTLREMEELLDKEIFVRISRFEIVNIKKIVSFDLSIVGTIKIKLEDGSETWVARRCVKTIQNRLRDLSYDGRKEL